MTESDSAMPVVAAIDSSDTAIHAALWAIDEAIARSVPLRLVCVTKATHPSADDYYADIHHAENAIRAARDAVESTGRPVKIETAILSGHRPSRSSSSQRTPIWSASALSASAEMLVRFWDQPQPSSPRRHGARSRSSALRTRYRASHPMGRRGGDRRTRQRVRGRARDGRGEAAWGAPVLMLGQRGGLDDVVGQWNARIPTCTSTRANGADVARFLKKYDEAVQLAVIGGSRAEEVMQIVGPYGHSPFRGTAASVLVVRN